MVGFVLVTILSLTGLMIIADACICWCDLPKGPDAKIGPFEIMTIGRVGYVALILASLAGGFGFNVPLYALLAGMVGITLYLRRRYIRLKLTCSMCPNVWKINGIIVAVGVLSRLSPI